MNLLKKLFNKKPADPSADLNGEKRTAFVEKQSAPRVRLLPLHTIAFVEKETQKTFDLGNISRGGVGIFHRNEISLENAQPIQGVLTIEKEQFGISCHLRHKNDVLAGFEMEVVDPQQKGSLNRAIESYLRLEMSALQMRAVNPAFIQKDPRGEVHWLTDGRQNELFCVCDSQGVVVFHLNFLGHYFEGERGKGVRAGVMTGANGMESAGRKSTAIIDTSEAISADGLEMAKSFVNNAVHSPASLRTDLLKFFSQI